MDFTFDGGGARFVSSRSRDAFIHLRGCVRTRLMNFSIDWDWEKSPLASVVEVKTVGKDFVDLLFREYADFPDKKAAFLVLSPFDPVTRSVGVEGMSTKGLARFWGKLSPFPGEWLAPNVARLKTSPDGLKVGELYRLQHYYYQMNGVSMDSNEHLRLERVTILSTPGHGFLIHGTQHHTLFDHVDIVAPKDDPRRVITCAADHLHVGQSRGLIATGSPGWAKTTLIIHQIGKSAMTAARIATPHFAKVQPFGVIAAPPTNRAGRTSPASPPRSPSSGGTHRPRPARNAPRRRRVPSCP
jgi:hypothetical protein